MNSVFVHTCHMKAVYAAGGLVWLAQTQSKHWAHGSRPIVAYCDAGIRPRTITARSAHQCGTAHLTTSQWEQPDFRHCDMRLSVIEPATRLLTTLDLERIIRLTVQVGLHVTYVIDTIPWPHRTIVCVVGTADQLILVCGRGSISLQSTANGDGNAQSAERIMASSQHRKWKLLTAGKWQHTFHFSYVKSAYIYTIENIL